MEQRPDLAELENHVRTIKWHSLGLQLGLQENELLAIEQQFLSNPDDCRRAMFNLWLTSNSNATRNKMLDALKSRSVSENYMADLYKEFISLHETTVKIKEVTFGQQNQTEHSSAAANTYEIVEDEAIKRAEELNQEFTALVTAIYKSLSKSNIDVGELKLEILLFLNFKRQNTPEVREHLSKLNSLNTSQDLLNYLIMNNFIGYLNYELLKVFQNVLGSKEIAARISRYQQNYSCYLKFSFTTIIKSFKERPDLAPASPIDLPNFQITLQSQWEGRSVYHWKTFFDSQFEWAPDLIVTSVTMKCVILTYAVLPFFVLSVVKDLSNSETLKQLEDEGVAVELSSELLRHEQVVRNKSTNRSIKDQLHSMKNQLEARLVVLEDTCKRHHEDIEKQGHVKQEEPLSKQHEGMEKMEKTIEEQRDFIMSLQDVCRKQQEEMSKQAEEFHQALKYQEQNLHNIHRNIIAPRYAVCLNALHEYWYSPPFYSHPDGYKLCLRIKTSVPPFTNHYNVYGEIHLLPGECDQDLQWPVDINIMVNIFCHQAPQTITSIYKITKAERPEEIKDPAKSKRQDLMQHIKHSRVADRLDHPHYILYSADIAILRVDFKPYNK